MIELISGKLLARRAVLSTFGSLAAINAAVAALSFLTTILIANRLGAESFGSLSFAVAVGTYGLMFVQYGLEKSFVRDLVHFKDRFGELVKASLLLRASLLGLFLGVIAVAWQLLSVKGNEPSATVLIILATVLPAFHLQGVYDAWKEMPRQALYSAVERCFYFSLVWVTVTSGVRPLSLNLVGVFMLIAAAVGLLLQYRWAWPRIQFRSVQGLRESTLFIIHSNVWLWLAVLAGLSIDYLSQIFLKLYGNSAELGVYSAAWRITQIPILFLAQAARIGAEATARHTRPGTSSADRGRFLLKYVALMIGIGALTSVPLLVAPTRLLSLFSSEYRDAVQILRIFSAYPFLFAPYLALLQFVVASRLQRIYFTLITVAGLLSVGLSLWLIPVLQAKGAALAVIASLFLALILFAAAVALNLLRNRDGVLALSDIGEFQPRVKC